MNWTLLSCVYAIEDFFCNFKISWAHWQTHSLPRLFDQDTLYLHYGKHYLRDCYIEGSVDFIFGNSTALLEHCHIHCKSEGFITAQSRKSSQETTGYVFLRYLRSFFLGIFAILFSYFTRINPIVAINILVLCVGIVVIDIHNNDET